MAARLSLARRDADAGVRGGVDQINSLTTRIASLNASLATVSANGSEALHLQDEMSVALDSLSGLVDISTINRADGGVDLSFGNGHPLVIGANAYQLTLDSTRDGLASIVSEGTDVTSEITSGRIGGLLSRARRAHPRLSRSRWTRWPTAS